MQKRLHKSRASFSLLIGLFLVACAPLVSCSQTAVQAPGAPASLTFTTIDYPGSTETILFKINGSGEIVGGYFDGPDVEHGLLLQAGSFTTFDDPNGVGQTQAEGINDAGAATGTYYDSGTGLEPGFLRQPNGSMIDIVPPASNGYTEANGINNSGTIVGRYTTDAGFQGFEFSNGNYTTIDVPGAAATSIFGGNDNGQIVGDYTDASGVIHGFLLSGGNFTTIDFPGATSTNCQDINDGGKIVGSTVIDDVRHGYLYSSGNFTIIDEPNASQAASGAPLSGTDVHGINANGVIVGSYTDTSGVIHGFEAR